MELRRRTFLQFAGAATASALAPVAEAQVYPARPITMVVPFAAGGPADIPGRVIAERMRKSLGQPVVIENIGGAAGSIGIATVQLAARDGAGAVAVTTSSAERGERLRKLGATHVLDRVGSLPRELLARSWNDRDACGQ